MYDFTVNMQLIKSGPLFELPQFVIVTAAVCFIL